VIRAIVHQGFVDEQDARMRNDFLSNSGLDRFQVEELESEYFEMRNFPPELLEFIQTTAPTAA
jgi:uncharacterized protein (TIGR04442 family)